jgi:hypothetical protein
MTDPRTPRSDRASAGEGERAGARDPEAGGETGERGLGHWLRPYFADSTLWPVLFVAAAIGLTFGAATLLAALRLRNPFAIAALLILLVASGEAGLREVRGGGAGLVVGVLAGLWTGSAVVAGLALWLGVF